MNSMDPFETLNVDVFPFILQHLSVKNILQVSCVNSKWNSIVENSKVCMSKLWLRFYYPFFNVECLPVSRRKYRNVKIQRIMNPMLEELFYKTLTWKEVMLRDMKFEDMKNYERIIDHLAPFVEKLELWNISFAECSSPPPNHSRPVSFASLKTLKCHIVKGSHRPLAVLIDSHSCLNELIISTDASLESQDREVFCNMIDSLLKLNTQVKHLTSDLPESFENISRQTTIQLESLKTTFYDDEESNEGFIELIRTQVGLKKISIDFNYSHGDIFAKIWNSMHNCETFELINAPENLVSNDLKVQQTITSFKFTGGHRNANSFLRATPNLKKLIVGQLTDDVLTYAAYSLKSLKDIKFVFESGQIENYNEMKQNENEINKNIILRLQTVADFLRGENN